MSDITEVSQESPPPPSSPRAGAPPARSWRPVWVALITIVLAAVAIPSITVTVLFGPYLRDDWRLDHIVRAVALDWRDFGLEKGKARLQYELDRQGVGEQIGDDTCTFADADGAKTIECTWKVNVHLPGTNTAAPLSFESRAQVTPAGDLI